MKRRITAAVAVILMSALTLSACHTVKGVGQDVEGSGKAIERSSGK